MLRRAVELGINLIDTADSYGPEVSERLIAEALVSVSRRGLVIATKAGFEQTWPRQVGGEWTTFRTCGKRGATSLKQTPARSHRPLPAASYRQESAARGADRHARRASTSPGKIRHIGLSEVSVEQIEAARKLCPIVSVQNELQP